MPLPMPEIKPKQETEKSVKKLPGIRKRVVMEMKSINSPNINWFFTWNFFNKNPFITNPDMIPEKVKLQ